MSDKKPSITVAPNGPYIVSDLERLAGPAGALETKPKFGLCRCGASARKPFCDGTHAKIAFSGDNTADPAKDKRTDYAGDGITVHDNRGICAHAAICTEGLPSVFNPKSEPWLDPNGASADDLIAAVNKCPSGALSYTVDGAEQREKTADAGITAVKGGPYVCVGGVELNDVSRGDSVAVGHFTLCRCGASKNKPFCDGTHWNVDFDSDGSD